MSQVLSGRVPRGRIWTAVIRKVSFYRKWSPNESIVRTILGSKMVRIGATNWRCKSVKRMAKWITNNKTMDPTRMQQQCIFWKYDFAPQNVFSIYFRFLFFDWGFNKTMTKSSKPEVKVDARTHFVIFLWNKWIEHVSTQFTKTYNKNDQQIDATIDAKMAKCEQKYKSSWTAIF